MKLEPTTYRPGELRDRWPRQWQKAVAAVERLMADRVVACRHVVGGAVAGLCADHPAVLQCWDRCLRRHVLRHPRDLELTCDECGEVCYSIRGCALFWPVPDLLEVRDTRSCRRRIEGFVVVGLGVCATCDAERDRAKTA